MKTKDMPLKKVTMQIKPHLLYAPELFKMTSKAADYNANYQIFDRVVVARETDKFSVGMRGTVTGINRVKDLNPVRQDCVNRVDIYCEVLFDDQNGNCKSGRVIVENLVNISYGQTLSGDERILVKTEKVQNDSKKSDFQQNTSASFSSMLKTSSRKENGPQKNQNFTDLWNTLKDGGPSLCPGGGSFSNSKPVTSTPRNSLPSNYDLKENKDARQTVDSQRKLSDAITRKMENVNLNSNKKKTSPVPNDQSVPIMISPPTKLPTPPLEWLSSNEPPAEPQKIFVKERPRPKLEMPQQQIHRPPQMVQNSFMPNAPRPQHFVPQLGFQHPVAMFPQRVRMIQPVPMMTAPIIMQQPMPPQQAPFFKSNEPFFANNQRFFHNSSYNNNNSHNNMMQQGQSKFRQQPNQPPSAPVQSNSQQNPFVPLQAARKSTKGKDLPGTSSQPSKKEVIQKVEEPKKTEQMSQATMPAAIVPSPVINDIKDSPAVPKTADPRKSRLAIKF